MCGGLIALYLFFFLLELTSLSNHFASPIKMLWDTRISFHSLTEPDVLDVRGTGSTTPDLAGCVGAVSATI